MCSISKMDIENPAEVNALCKYGEDGIQISIFPNDNLVQ